MRERLSFVVEDRVCDVRCHAILLNRLCCVVKCIIAAISLRAPDGYFWTLIEQRSVPGFREIVDLSPANDSRFLESVGPSGHFLSKDYDSFLSDWKNVRYRMMRTDKLQIETGARGRLRLSPAK